jgi:hypothetical protein
MTLARGLLIIGLSSRPTTNQGMTHDGILYELAKSWLKIIDSAYRRVYNHASAGHWSWFEAYDGALMNNS